MQYLAMNPINGFPPLEGSVLRVLILGSMPSVRSLEYHQYYGHPRNAFWPIMGELFGAGPELPYQERTKLLTARGIGVWDVIQSCVRPGSLDAAIDDESVVYNDLGGLFARHAELHTICLNGGKAMQSFQRYRTQTRLDIGKRRLIQLPSTSPAHAAWTFEQKCEAWWAVSAALRSKSLAG